MLHQYRASQFACVAKSALWFTLVNLLDDFMKTSTHRLSLTVTTVLLEADDFCVFIALDGGPSERQCKVHSPVSVIPGDAIYATGRWKRHTKYGWQFIADQVRYAIPTTAAGIQAYLSTGHIEGIGKTLAGYLVRRFGTDTLDIIENNPLKLTEVRGIGPEKAQRIARDINYHRAYVHHQSTLGGWGLPEHVIRSLDGTFGSTLLSSLKKDPYSILAANPYFDFSLADKIGDHIAVPDDDPRRISGAMNCVLHDLEISSGATLISADSLARGLDSILGGRHSHTDVRAIAQANTLFTWLPDGKEASSSAGCIVSAQRDFQSSTICKRLKERQLAAPDFTDLLDRLDGRPTNPASLPVADILNSALTVITGHNNDRRVASVLLLLEQLHEKTNVNFHIAAMSLTRASKLGQHTAIPVSALQSLLIKSESQSAPDPLKPIDVLIITDAQLLEMNQLHKLVSLLPQKACLILIGDPRRLPPIAAGDPFISLIAANIGLQISLSSDAENSDSSTLRKLSQQIAKGSPVHIPEYTSIQSLGLNIDGMRCEALLTDDQDELEQH